MSLEVPAPQAGVLTDIIAQEGDTVEVDAILALLQEGAVKVSSTNQSVKNEPEAKIETQTQNLSPAVRRLVEENNLDVKVISASGKDGRLTKADILAYLESDLQNVTPPSEVVLKTQVLESSKSITGKLREERVPMSRLRRVIAQR